VFFTYDLLSDSDGPPGIHSDVIFQLDVTLNSKHGSVHGDVASTTTQSHLLSSNCGLESNGQVSSSAGPDGIAVDPSLFTFAANGDHVNAWDIVVTAKDPNNSADQSTVKYRLPEKRFADMTFEKP
jgi:hypothetical protein